MDYKKIFKKEKTRYAILNFFGFVPDNMMIKLQYLIKTGRKPDLRSPKRYSEKLQKYKLGFRNPLMAECVDKFSVRKYVEDCGYGEILNECYGVFDSFEDISWDNLPDEFVLKDTLGGGGRSMIPVSDKGRIDIQEAEKTVSSWIDKPLTCKSPGREWVYENRKHRIIAEKLLSATDDGDLPDYKFFCFGGKVFCSYMMKNYTMNHSNGVLGFLDRDFRLLDVRRTDYLPMKNQPEKPKNYEKMIEIAEKLSSPFPHARVDLYNISGKIIFGEITFFTSSGYMKFEPDEFDFLLGEKFDI